MKKLLMVVSIILMLSFVSSMVFGGVSIRIRKISQTDLGVTEALVVVVESQSTKAYKINRFSGAFNIEEMNSFLVSTVFTYRYFDNGRYPGATQNCDANGWVNWNYQVTGADTLQVSNNYASNGWQELIRLTLTYTKDWPTFADFSFADSPYENRAMWYVGFFGDNWNMWQTAGIVDGALSPHQLPVEMGNISATYGKEGVQLAWNTMSEVDNAGFNIYCKYTDLSGSEIQNVERFVGFVKGSGNSSTGEAYTFTDKSAPANQDLGYSVYSVNSSGEEDGFYHVFVVTSLPEEFTMYQNFPNPFNPATNIVYDLTEAGFVKLNVYNILGQRVRTLVNSFQEANRHQINWDGLDDSGNVLPSGVYVYKVEAGDNVQIKKMIKLQ